MCIYICTYVYCMFNRKSQAGFFWWICCLLLYKLCCHPGLKSIKWNTHEYPLLCGNVLLFLLVSIWIQLISSFASTEPCQISSSSPSQHNSFTQRSQVLSQSALHSSTNQSDAPLRWRPFSYHKINNLWMWLSRKLVGYLCSNILK